MSSAMCVGGAVGADAVGKPLVYRVAQRETGELRGRARRPRSSRPAPRRRDAGSVVLRRDDGELAVSVADPTRHGTRVRLEVAVAAAKVVSADKGITVGSLNPLTFTVDVTGTAGETKTLRITLQGR
ncbi:hypothetical protein [Streptomyces sp. NPDC001815]|uniref:hypothetical protein n=1 Tax=Streptomyces sp. NPDC001815 TaxID=3154526 RepID=UPI0033315177